MARPLGTGGSQAEQADHRKILCSRHPFPVTLAYPAVPRKQGLGPVPPISTPSGGGLGWRAQTAGAREEAGRGTGHEARWAQEAGALDAGRRGIQWQHLPSAACRTLTSSPLKVLLASSSRAHRGEVCESSARPARGKPPGECLSAAASRCAAPHSE